ncbi:hypothetical protein PWT90_08628 [Aphanocladium album]|nr:hypothetical protein PWT90_08628 [Aphanocladium album]
MDDSVGGGGWMPGELSELRLACEECHKRKIRCRASHSSARGTCEACWENQRQCLFSLKSKTGRPRKTGSSKNNNNSSSSARHAANRRRESTDEPLSPPSFGDDSSSSSSTATRRHATTQQQQRAAAASMGGQLAAYFSSGIESLPPSSPLFFSTLQHHAADLDKEMSTVSVDVASQDEDMTGDAMVGSIPLPSAFDGAALLSDNATTDQNSIAGCFYDMPPIVMSGAVANTAALADFFDVMQICNEIHGWSQNCALDLCADAGRAKVLAMFGTIDRLFHRVLRMPPPPDHQPPQTRKLSAALPLPAPPAPPQRKEQYSCTILRVAVEEAVEIAADLVAFNLQQQKQQCSQGDASVMDTDAWLPGLDAPAKTTPAAHRQLETMMLLCRLDHCLFYFGAFIAAQQGTTPPPGNRAEQVRRQAWGYLEKLRDGWA